MSDRTNTHRNAHGDTTDERIAENSSAPNRRDVLRTGAVGAGAIAIGAAMVGTSFPRPALAQASPGVRIGQFASTGPGMTINTYWIDTPDGVLVVDGQWTLPFAREAMAKMRSEVGDKPIVGLLITHDHTDHYGGMNAIVEAAREGGTDGLPIYASRQTALSLANDAQGFQANRAEEFGDDFGETTTPNRIVGDGDTIDLGGTVLRVMERPHCEAPTTTMLHIESAVPANGEAGAGVLICADMVFDRHLPGTREGFTAVENWLVELGRLNETHADAVLHMGHGTPRRGADVIAEQQAILRDLRDPVYDAVMRDGVLEEAVRDEIVTKLMARYGSWNSIIGLPHERVLALDLDWIARDIDVQPPEAG